MATQDPTTYEAEIDDRLGKAFGPGVPSLSPPPQQPEETMAKAKKKTTKKKAKRTLKNGNGDKSKLTIAVEEFEAGLIVKALKKAKGSIRQAATDLGTYRGALYKKIDRLGINPEQYR